MPLYCYFFVYLVFVQIVVYSKYEAQGIRWTLSPSCAWNKQIIFDVAANQSYDKICALAIGDSCESSCHKYAGTGWPGNFLIIESKGLKSISKCFEIFIFIIYVLCIFGTSNPQWILRKNRYSPEGLPESTSFEKNCCTEGDDFEFQMRQNGGDQFALCNTACKTKWCTPAKYYHPVCHFWMHHK